MTSLVFFLPTMSHTMTPCASFWIFFGLIQICLKSVESAICTRLMEISCLVIVYEYHTFRVPPFIYLKIHDLYF
jgi:hypothetical protein